MIKKIITIVIISIAIFSFGTIAGASNNWVADIVGNAKSNMKQDVKNNTDVLIQNLESQVGVAVEDRLSEVIDYQSNKANEAIEEYFNQRVNEISNSPELSAVSSDIVQSVDSLINEEKARIDQAIAEMIQ